MQRLTEGFKGLQIHAGEHGGYMVLSLPDNNAPALKPLFGGNLSECLDFIQEAICRHEDQ